jgi:hypothetical protein
MYGSQDTPSNHFVEHPNHSASSLLSDVTLEIGINTHLEHQSQVQIMTYRTHCPVIFLKCCCPAPTKVGNLPFW